MAAHQEVLVVVADPDGYDEAMNTWRRSAAVTQLLPPRLALMVPAGTPPEVSGTRWYSDTVPTDVLLSLAPHERIFIAAWRDRRAALAGVVESVRWDGAGPEAPGPLPGNARGPDGGR